MIIPCKEIGNTLAKHLSQTCQDLKSRGIHPALEVFLLGDNPEQRSFIRIKERIARELGIGYHAQLLPLNTPATTLFEQIAHANGDPRISGLIVQLPLPAHIPVAKLYELISPRKEIEGHAQNSMYHFPLSLAVCSAIKYIITGDARRSRVSLPADYHLLHTFLTGKKIVIAGRGPTGGGPIARICAYLQAPCSVVHSQTQNPSEYFRSADLIITAAGRHLLNAQDLKKGVILLNVGLRHEEGKLKGDYDEAAIETIASYHTITPGGLGPLDVLYLYANLLQSLT